MAKQPKANVARPVYDVGLPPITVHRTVPDVNTLRDEAALAGDKLNWGVELHGLPRAWRQSLGRDIKIAVLDTGIDPDHPDLVNAIEATRDFTGEGVEDLNGHGTHCAGIIAARQNSVGYIGVAPESRLLVAKVLPNNKKGTYSAIAAGVDWAVGENADIVSMSLGGSSSNGELFGAIHRALAANKIVVCAAGNAGSLFHNSIGYPGRYGSVIAVGAHDPFGNPAGFSSRGGEIDLMAPGTDIWSAHANGGYRKLSGTSMATPFVAGICALILAKHRRPGRHRTPIQNNEDMRQHLLAMTAHPGHHDNARGYGPLQPFAAFGPNT